MPLYQDSIDIGESLTIERLGLLLGLGYTFTDFFAQGLSFKQAAYFIHLSIQSGRLSAGNIRVPLTRPSSIDDIRLLAPLFKNPKEKEAIVQKFINAFKPDPAYVAEMERLKGLHDATVARFSAMPGVPTPTAPYVHPQPSTTPIPLSPLAESPTSPAPPLPSSPDVLTRTPVTPRPPITQVPHFQKVGFIIIQKFYLFLVITILEGVITNY